MPDAQPNSKHKATGDYWLYYRQLPAEIQSIADKNIALLKSNPRHPSLQFKKVGKVWSVRIGLHYRALAAEVPNGFLWFWIGHHDQYEDKIK